MTQLSQTMPLIEQDNIEGSPLWRQVIDALAKHDHFRPLKQALENHQPWVPWLTVNELAEIRTITVSAGQGAGSMDGECQDRSFSSTLNKIGRAHV